MLFMILSMVAGIVLVVASFLLASPLFRKADPVWVKKEVQIPAKRRH